MDRSESLGDFKYVQGTFLRQPVQYGRGDVACYPWASLPSPFPLGDGLGIAPYNKNCQLSGCHAYFLMLDI